MFGEVFVFTFESMESPTFLDYYRGISDLNGVGPSPVSPVFHSGTVFSELHKKRML